MPWMIACEACGKNPHSEQHPYGCALCGGKYADMEDAEVCCAADEGYPCPTCGDAWDDADDAERCCEENPEENIF